MMASTKIQDVMLGSQARIFASSVNIDYDSDNDRNTIFDMRNDDKFLLISKRIGSKITIEDVKIINDDLIDSMFTE